MRQRLTLCRTAFQLQNTGRLQSNLQPKCNTGKILEMYGDLGKSYPYNTIDRVANRWQRKFTSSPRCIQDTRFST